MGTVGDINCTWELLVMLSAVIPLVLASVVSGQLPDHLKALCPAYPNCDNALLAAYDKIYQDSLAPAGGPQAPVATSAELPCANYPFCDVNHAALAQGLPCANFPNCDVHHIAIAQRGKRQAALPVTPGNIPGLVPGSPAAAQWWAAQIAHQGQLAHHLGKREAAQYPAGVSAASCPNYPFCNLAPVVPLGYVNTAGYPAGVSAAVCPGYPYC